MISSMAPRGRVTLEKKIIHPDAFQSRVGLPRDALAHERVARTFSAIIATIWLAGSTPLEDYCLGLLRGLRRTTMNIVRRLLRNVGLAQQESSSEESESSLSSESESEDESSVQETLSDREFSRGDKVEAKIPNVTYEYKPAEILKYDYGKGGDGKFTIKFLHNNYVVHEIKRHHLRSIRETTLIASGTKFHRGHRIEARQYKREK